MHLLHCFGWSLKLVSHFVWDHLNLLKTPKFKIKQVPASQAARNETIPYENASVRARLCGAEEGKANFALGKPYHQPWYV